MAPQVWRVMLVFAALGTVFLVLRSVMVPESFGQQGFYRAEALAELASQQPKFAGRETCAACHITQAEMTPHVLVGVGCESCHGPSAKHAEDFEVEKPPLPTTRAFCSSCHEKIAARPKDFPQIATRDHHPQEKCVTCHTIHPTE